MQCANLNTIDFTREEKSEGIRIKPKTDAKAALPKSESSVLLRLLAASKDAEAIIACLFEQQLISAEPLQQIWDRLAAAITEAQLTLQARHKAGPSAPSSRF
ncbi:MAG: hypothetical protein QUT30_11135 [Acidobacteriota bacterium]|nr:hypothetical protein [Acidobacteriota bacterium]